MAGTYVSGFWQENSNGVTGTVTSRPLNSTQTTAMFNALIGAAPGGTVNAVRNRIGHKRFNLGSEPGEPVVPTAVVELARASTAADVAALKNLVVNINRAPVPYPRDRSGNGGPAL